MKKRKIYGLMLFMLTSLLLCSALTQTASAAVVDVYLKAVATNKVMPDGTDVPMWGFAGCDSTFTTCSAATIPGPSLPGPSLTAIQGDTLNIHVRNDLSGLYTEPVSIVIPGQIAPMTPVWINSNGDFVSTGSRPVGDVTSRMRSLTTETPADATTVITYTWTNIKAGTYLYLSGTHGSLQVPMGLYGSLTVLSAVGQAYPANPNVDSTFAAEQVLLFSEIDPVLNQAVADGTYGTPSGPTSSIGYHPRYFLINGEPFTYGRSPLPVAIAGQRTLLRFLNAGLQDHTPMLQGIYGEAIAEDGNLYPFGKKQYSLQLPAGKTVDVIMTPTAEGYIPLYDRMLSLTNAAESPGGMMLYLEVPSLTQYLLTVNKTGAGTGKVMSINLPGGILCGTACGETYNANTILNLAAVPDAGSVFSGWTGACTGTGNCLVTMDAAKTVSAEFILGNMYTLTVAGGGGTGSGGTVTGPGINCSITGWIGSGDCTEQYPADTEVLLTATGAAGSAFTSWSGACTGAGACNVTMDGNKMVAGQFDIGTYTLTVNGSGTGSGNVSGPGITCAIANGVAGGDCTEQILAGTNIGLNASASAGSSFTGWSGGCAGTGACNFAMNADTTVTAAFANAITVSAPNGGGSWAAGTTLPITWTYAGNPGSNVRIELLNDPAGTVNRTIISSRAIGTGGNGSYNWPIPSNQVGGTYKVRVTSTTNAAATDTSDAFFTILGPTITVTAPNGGGSWAAGTTLPITWTYTGNPGSNVRIELLNDPAGTVNRTIISSRSIGTGGNGSYNWTIPSNQVVGTYKVRVTSTTNAVATDTSDVSFTITGPPPPTILVTAPNTGVSWAAGTTQTISWTYAGNPGSNVRIELLNDPAGTVNRTIISSRAIGTGGNGSYNWNIPSNQTGGNYRIRVTSTSNGAATSTSNVFTITGPPPPTVTVTTPAGGESWAAGTGHQIQWTYAGNTGTFVRIELLNEPSGTVNRTIAGFVSIGNGGSGSYNWNILSNQTGGSYRIRVTSLTNGAATGTSNVFTIP